MEVSIGAILQHSFVRNDSMTSSRNIIGVNEKRSHHKEKVKTTRNSVTDFETNSSITNRTNKKRSNNHEVIRSGSLVRGASDTTIGIMNSTKENRAQKSAYHPSSLTSNSEAQSENFSGSNDPKNNSTELPGRVTSLTHSKENVNPNIVHDQHKINEEDNTYFRKVYDMIDENITECEPEKPPCLPFHTVEDVSAFEAVDNDTYAKVIEYSRWLGGHTLEDAVKMTFNEAMTPACAFNYTMYGTSATDAFDNTRVRKALYRGVSKNFKPTNDQFAHVLSERLRCARQIYRNQQSNKSE